MNERWHPVYTWLDDPDDITTKTSDVMHPNEHCHVSVSSRGDVRYECEVAYEIDNAGIEQFNLPLGWSLLQVKHEKIVGPTWTEWDMVYDVRPMIDLDRVAT